jgi:5'-deoxynucleotidase YfbR-like HD superfamily hydrolase
MILQSRDEELKLVIRYKQNSACKPMYYTPDLFIHIQRVTWMAEGICNQLELWQEITQKVTRRAMFHDDCEIIAWDIATPVKQNWTIREKKIYERKCSQAIPILDENYWNILWDDYASILQEMETFHIEWSSDEDILIHAIIEYADKLDAYMETFHELYSWSAWFLSNMNSEFNFDKTCWEYITDRVIKRRKQIKKALWKKIPQIWYFNTYQITQLDINEIVSIWEKHTHDSVLQNSEVEIYELWKQLHFNTKNNEYISYLYTQNITK